MERGEEEGIYILTGDDFYASIDSPFGDIEAVL